MQAAYAGLSIAPEALPVARDLARKVLSLPMGPHLNLGQVDQIIASLQSSG